jgi:hypothetical protein
VAGNPAAGRTPGMPRLTSWRVLRITDRVADQGLVVRGELAEADLDAADQRTGQRRPNLCAVSYYCLATLRSHCP